MAKQGTDVIIRQPEFSLAELERLSVSFAKSAFFQDSKDAAQALVKIAAGRELGLPPVYSMTKIFFVQGRLTLSAEAMGALIKKTNGEYDYHVDTLNNTECVISFFHNGKVEYVSTFTVKDAEAAELIKEHGNWRKWPRAMLMSKALSQGARIVCPHIISGAYTPEDFGIETDDEGYPTQPQRMTENASVPLVGEIVDDDAENDRQAEEADELAKQFPSVIPAQEKQAGETVLNRAETSQGGQGTAQVGKQEGTPVKAKRDPATIKNAGNLVNACMADFGMTAKEVYKELGINSVNDLTIKPSDAYATIAKSREGK